MTTTMNDPFYEQDCSQLKPLRLQRLSLSDAMTNMHCSNTDDVAPPDSPSSTTTVHKTDFPPLFYTPPTDEAVPQTMLHTRRVVRRRSSHLQRWIEDQRRLSSSPEFQDAYVPSDDDDVPAIGTACHPYLAYPQLSVRSWAMQCDGDQDDKRTLESFIVLNDEDIRHADAEIKRVSQEEARPGSPYTPEPPVGTPSKSRKYSTLLHTPSPLRNLGHSLSARRSSSSTVTSVSGSPSSSRLSEAKSGRESACSSNFESRHKRGPSWGSIRLSGYRSSNGDNPSLSNGWTFKRPSVLGHFASGTQTSLSSQALDEDELTAPRPSFSSVTSYSSVTSLSNQNSNTGRLASRTMSLGSTRALQPVLSKPSSQSPYPGPVTYDSSPDDRQGGSIKRLAHKSSALRVPFSSKLPVNNATMMAPAALPTTMHFGNKIPNVLGTPNYKRKKKLVISGLREGEVGRFDAVKRWCESFGELSQITRMPNGDIYVHFRKAEVADHVCRLNAQVYIDGVGSVSLSWFAGKKPS